MTSRTLVLLTALLAGLFIAPYAGWGYDDEYYQMDDNAMLHMNEGQKWMSVRQYEAAIREYQIGIRLKPHSAVSAALYNNMGIAYTKIGDTPKAVISFQKAISLDPHFSLYYENLAKAYYDSGMLEQSATDLRNNLETHSNQASGWYLLGVMYEKLGDKSASKSAFQRYLQLAPNSTLADAAREKLGRS